MLLPTKILVGVIVLVPKLKSSVGFTKPTPLVTQVYRPVLAFTGIFALVDTIDIPKPY